MGKLKFIIGILILFTYFTPFISCNDFNSSNIQTSDSSSINSDNSSGLKDTANSVVNDSLKINSQSSEDTDTFWDKLLGKAICPTENSISGFGTILIFKNVVGRTFIGLSFFLSIVLLIPLKFLKRKKLRLYLIELNMLCVILFTIDGLFFADANLLWGTWLLLTLIIFEFFIEIKTHN